MGDFCVCFCCRFCCRFFKNLKTQPSASSTGCFCDGSDTASVNCSSGAAKTWSAWSDAGPCSVSCGYGAMSQSRTCVGCVGECDGAGSQSVPCFNGRVKTWSAWTDVSLCSPASCSFSSGNKTQVRSCEGCRGACPASDATNRSAPCYVEKSRQWTLWELPINSTCNSSCAFHAVGVVRFFL